MPNIIATLRAPFALVALAAALFSAGHVFAADIQERPAANLRLSEYSSRACVEDCITQCRAARAQCSGNNDRGDECRAKFQICARRCVVSCNPR